MAKMKFKFVYYDETKSLDFTSDLVFKVEASRKKYLEIRNENKSSIILENLLPSNGGIDELERIDIYLDNNLYKSFDNSQWNQCVYKVFSGIDYLPIEYIRCELL